MAGNEKAVCEFLFSNMASINLKHLGQLVEIGIPLNNRPGYRPAKSLDEISEILTTDSQKKADVYLNSMGVSIKQAGSSFAFNRLQRANILEVYSKLGLTNPQSKITQMDREVKKFHEGLLPNRNVPWQEFLSEKDFKTLLNYLMMLGSPNIGKSIHPAELILEAPAKDISISSIFVYSFNEYFENYKEKFQIAIRRQWVGQSSNSEHKRAVGLSSKLGNFPWVFNEVVGTPRLGWRDNVEAVDRKTVYFLMIEKKT
ncbi:MAG: hypothetical protein WBG73_24495 [Coleofasciculaceae cyanobacterium]